MAGLTAAALAWLAGVVFERWWLGPTDATAAARVESLVRREFEGMTAALAEVATAIASHPSARELTASAEAAPALFDLLASERATSPHPDDIAVTVYDAVRGDARAWSGRPSDMPPDRIVGPQDLFVTRSALGLRLVLVQPIVSSESAGGGGVTNPAGPGPAAPGVGEGRRVGAVAVEHVLSRAAAGAAIAQIEDSFPTSIAPVSFRPRSEGAGETPRPGAFLLRTPAGAPILEGFVALTEVQAARADWRRTVIGWVIVILGVTQLLLIGPLLDSRSRAREPRPAVRDTLAASLLLLGGAAAIWLGLTWSAESRSGLPLTLSFSAITVAALAALWASPATLLHTAVRPRRAPRTAGLRFVLLNLLAGAAMAGLVLAFARVLAIAVDPATVDVRHFSLYPWNGARVLRLAGILALHVAALWAATLILIAARGAWRLPSPAFGPRLALLTLWVAPTVVASVIASLAGWRLPLVGLLLSSIACAVAAILARRVVVWYRHATIAARIFGLFVAFLVPAVLLYPSLNFFAEHAIERLITIYAVEAQNHSATLLARLKEAQDEIEQITTLPELVKESGDAEARPDPKNAFFVWSQTVLARARLTSAVELYSATGTQVSRFALNLPEYTGSARQPQAAPSCQWDVFGEPLPIGSQKRLVLHAERALCLGRGDDPRLSGGTIVLHLAVDDYRTLPFITSQSPYFELFRPSPNSAERELAPGNDVHVAIYGWGLEPVYTSGLSAWPITDELFRRIYHPAREPFWETIRLKEDTYQVYFTNNRARIYAIGYPRLTLFDHLVHLAEVSTLAGAAFVLVLLATAIFTRLSRERPRVGRALLREIRASFYRKLFLAFVLASIIPVLILAFVIRAYFADLLRKDIQGEAARTASVAQRVIEESDALLNRGADGVELPNDDVMVWISQVIDQDVNIFNGPSPHTGGLRSAPGPGSLVATSERDLYSSGLLPTRTPDAIYRAIVLQRLPSFVAEDVFGSTPYLIAATPVRTGGQRENPDRARGTPAARHRARDRRSRSRRPPRRAVLHPARGGARLVAGRAHRRSRPPADARDTAHRTRRFRRPHRGALRRRVAAPGRRLQQHGRRAQGAARRARAHASSRGLGRDGAPGGARDQEPADAHPTVGRAPPAGPCRQGPAPRDRARRLRARDPRSGAPAPPDRVRVLELRLGAESEAGAGRPAGARGRSPRSVPRRPRGPDRDPERRRGAAAAGRRRPHAHSARAREHRRERAARDARGGRAQRRRVRRRGRGGPDGARQRRGDGRRRAGACVRALLLH